MSQSLSQILSEVLYVRIQPELRDELKSEAFAYGISLSDYVRLLLKGDAKRPDKLLSLHPLVNR